MRCDRPQGASVFTEAKPQVRADGLQRKPLRPAGAGNRTAAGGGFDLGVVYKASTVDECVDAILRKEGITRAPSSGSSGS